MKCSLSKVWKILDHYFFKYCFCPCSFFSFSGTTITSFHCVSYVSSFLYHLSGTSPWSSATREQKTRRPLTYLKYVSVKEKVNLDWQKISCKLHPFCTITFIILFFFVKKLYSRKHKNANQLSNHPDVNAVVWHIHLKCKMLATIMLFISNSREIKGIVSNISDSVCCLISATAFQPKLVTIIVFFHQPLHSPFIFHQHLT